MLLPMCDASFFTLPFDLFGVMSPWSGGSLYFFKALHMPGTDTCGLIASFAFQL